MAKRLLVGTLGDQARAMITVSIYCNAVPGSAGPHWARMCGNRATFATDDLVAQYGPDMTVQGWLDRSRCSCCGSKELDLKVAPCSHEYRNRRD